VKVPLLSGRQVVAALQRPGFVEIHRKGNHVKMEHPDGRRIVFPFNSEIDRYTLKGALQDADVELAEFLEQGQVNRTSLRAGSHGSRRRKP
jgi:predicted RNA binding protein YcfA (HicA-like mRNA interferase family)